MSIENLKHDASELLDFAHISGVRPDWHEPNEVIAISYGRIFDNAGVSGEKTVRLRHSESEKETDINLATLFALATYGAEKLMKGES